MSDLSKQRLMRFPEVQAVTGLSRQTIWRLMTAVPPKFPKPLKLGRVTAWPQKSIVDWMTQQIAERDADPAITPAGEYAPTPFFDQPLVAICADGGFEWFVERANQLHVAYEHHVSDAGDALRWVEHMAVKSWVTPAHLEQFARLVADKFGVEYR